MHRWLRGIVLVVTAIVLTTGCATMNTPTGAPSSGGNVTTPGKPKWTATQSGLKYEDIQEGKGALPLAGQRVQVHYVGWLSLDGDGTLGKQFDSSRNSPQPFEFTLGKGEVIKGWDEGVATMKVGSKRRLLIPAPLAYGATANGPIPANSMLVFEVELLGVK